jgi:hypothetical protein
MSKILNLILLLTSTKYPLLPYTKFVLIYYKKEIPYIRSFIGYTYSFKLLRLLLKIFRVEAVVDKHVNYEIYYNGRLQIKTDYELYHSKVPTLVKYYSPKFHPPESKRHEKH